MENKRMVKCLICGAVFEEGPEFCPVCGVSSENFVPVEPEKTAFSRDTDERFLILGGGTAALSAAEAIRSRNARCTITMLSNERALPYNRPMLTKNLFREGDRDAFCIHPAEWYEEKQIRLITDETVTKLDSANRRVRCESGREYVFDSCIYALGAHSFVQALDGSELDGVATIRNLDDIAKVRALTEDARDAVVIGGGVLGLEAAWELKKKGLRVSVLEHGDRLLKKQLDPEGSALLMQIAADRGVAIVTQASTAALTGDGRVAEVQLTDGRKIPAQLVVISTGVRPNTALFTAAGGEVERAIAIDAHCRTNLSHIYACGDCASYRGVNYSLWSEATAQGEIAGANAAGEALEYENPQPGLTLFTLDTALYAYGDLGQDAAMPYEVERRSNTDKQTMHTVVSLFGKPVGVLLIGDLADMERLTETIKEQA